MPDIDPRDHRDINNIFHPIRHDASIALRDLDRCVQTLAGGVMMAIDCIEHWEGASPQERLDAVEKTLRDAYERACEGRP